MRLAPTSMRRTNALTSGTIPRPPRSPNTPTTRPAFASGLSVPRAGFGVVRGCNVGVTAVLGLSLGHFVLERDDVDADAPFGARAHERAQRLRDAPAAPDHFAEIFVFHDELDDGALFGLDLFDQHVLRPRHELARQEREQIQRTLLRHRGIFGLARAAVAAVLAPRAPFGLACRRAAARPVAPVVARAAPRPLVLRLDVVVSRLVRRDAARTQRRGALFVGRLVVVAEKTELVVERAHD